jgi:hypothetical protein
VQHFGAFRTSSSPGDRDTSTRIPAHQVNQACIPNIGARERGRRLAVGLAMTAVSVVAAVWLLASGAPRGWRLLVFVPLFIAAIGLLQVRANTCVALAARGLRNMDAGTEAIADPAELRQVKAQARQVNVRAVTISAAVTAVLVAWPA